MRAPGMARALCFAGSRSGTHAGHRRAAQELPARGCALLTFMPQFSAHRHSMKIETNHVVQFHYTLRSPAGEEIESTSGGDPAVYLHGAENIIPGLEKAFVGKAAGESFRVTVPPEEAYGQPSDSRHQRVPKKYFPKGTRLTVGQRVVLQTDRGSLPVTIRKVGVTVVDVDANHPLAGQTLDFEVQIVDVREASAEEIAHRHAHGPGGHEH